MTTPPQSELELVEPRLVSIRFQGLFDADEANRVMDFIGQHVEGEPYFLFEAVMPGMTGATPEARSIAATRLKGLPQRGFAIIGGSFSQRLLAKLVLTASIMLDPGRNTGAFFKDSQSGRKWLREYAAKQDTIAR
jgi:hypothetical protein